MTDIDRGFSSDDLIREAREQLASSELVSQARRELDRLSEANAPQRIDDMVDRARRELDRLAAPDRRTDEREDEDETADPASVFTRLRDSVEDMATRTERPRRARPDVAERYESPVRRDDREASDGFFRTDEQSTDRGAGRIGRTAGRGLRRLAIFLAVIAGFSFLGEIDFSFVSDIGDAIDEVTEDAPATEVVPIEDLAAGTCIQQPPGDVIETVLAVGCTEPHDFEVIGEVVLPPGPYPGDDAVYTEALQTCEPVFETYVGIDYASSIWWLNSFTPTETGWDKGDRSATCLVFQFGGENEILQVTRSARGDGR